MNAHMLPEKYRVLELFARDWILPTQTARQEKRLTTSIAKLREFYDAMTPLMTDILEDFDAKVLEDLTDEENNLLQLSYGLAMVAPAIEFFHQPAVVCGFDARKFLPTLEAVANRPAMSVAREAFV